MRLFIAALCCASLPAFAAEPVTYDIKKLQHIDGASFRPGDKQYPAELADAGVQGEVLVVVPLTEDGSADGASVGESSRSAQLDQIAVDLVRAAKFKLKDAPVKGWKAVVVPVEFARDSVATLHLKTCADFNADYAYFAKTFPERQSSDMRIFEMLTGVLYFGAGGKPAQAAEVAKRAAAARQPTIDGCKAKPQNKMIDIWKDAVKAAS